MANDQHISHLASSSEPTSRAAPVSTRARLLDLVALLALLGVSTVVFVAVGPDAGAVTSVGLGLFATWRASHRT